MSVPVTYRPLRAGDEAAANAGFNVVFGQHRSEEEWRWKYGAGETRVMLALDQAGTVLAHYAALPVPFRAGDVTVTAGQIVDIYARREARQGLGGARVFSETVRRFVAEYCRPDRLAVTYGFPGARHMSLVRLGPGAHGEVEMAPQPVPYWTRDASARGRGTLFVRVRVGLDTVGADRLWERAGPRYGAGVVRDGSWLQRRFSSRPGVSYVHVSAWTHGRMAAWAVVRPGSPAAALVDLVWDGERAATLVALDRAVGRVVRGGGAERVETWLGGDPEAARVLATCGWQAAPHPAGLEMAAYSFHPHVDARRFPGVFYLTMADADLV